MRRPKGKREIPCANGCGATNYTGRLDLTGWTCPECVQAGLNLEKGPFAEPALTPEQKVALTRKSERKRLRATGRRAGGRNARGARR